jgi:Ca-activated chloride channel family protein
VLFIATDRHGKFVRNLNQNDFSIFDDHKPVESILNFRRETDLPIELGLLMDVSGSVQGRFGFEKEAATGFLQHIIRPGYDRAFVVGFNKESRLTQDFTDQVPLLAAGVQRLSNGGGTALYDAIYKACKEKLLREHSDHPIRKAIVILSDGEDNQSEYTRAQAIEMAQRAEVLIYAISTDDSGLILRGDKVLEDLASATGGRAFFPLQDERHHALLRRHRRRTAQPVRRLLQALRLRRRRTLPLHPDHCPEKRSASPRPPRILRSQAINLKVQEFILRFKVSSCISSLTGAQSKDP